VERSIDPRVREAFITEGAHFLNAQDSEMLARVVATSTNTLNPKIVGKSVKVISEMAGIVSPEGTRALICELSGVGRDFPLSMEKLSPILAYYVVENLSEGCERCSSILRYGGMGHTASIHTSNQQAARDYGVQMPASRIVVNSPSTHGAIGFTTELEPSMTLGCGSWGGNVTSDNISPRHLIDIKRIAFETRPINKPSSVETVPIHAPSSIIDRAEIAAMVDRFLSERRIAQKPDISTALPQAHVASSPLQGEGEHESTISKVSLQSAAQQSNGTGNHRVYDFVCEEDVKRAIASREKIYITSRTIITPAARDLGEERDIFART